MSVTLADDVFDIYYDMARSAMVALLANGSPEDAVAYGKDKTGIVLVHNDEEYYFFLGGIPENEMAEHGYGRIQQLQIFEEIKKAAEKCEEEMHCRLMLTLYLSNRVYTIIVSPDKEKKVSREEIFQYLHNAICNAYIKLFGDRFSKDRMISVVTPALSGYGWHIQKEFAIAMDCICRRRFFMCGKGIVQSNPEMPYNISDAEIQLACCDIQNAMELRDIERLKQLLRQLFLDRLKKSENISLCNTAVSIIRGYTGNTDNTLNQALFIEDCYNQLLKECIKYTEENTPRLKPVSDEVMSADNYIMENSSRDLSLEEIAGYVGLNKTYFCTKYRNERGYTPHSFLMECRMNEARSLLISTDESVDIIAVKVGFNDSNYFRNTFKKRTGTTPTEFRNLRRGNTL